MTEGPCSRSPPACTQVTAFTVTHRLISHHLTSSATAQQASPTAPQSKFTCIASTCQAAAAHQLQLAQMAVQQLDPLSHLCRHLLLPSHHGFAGMAPNPLKISKHVSCVLLQLQQQSTLGTPHVENRFAPSAKTTQLQGVQLLASRRRRVQERLQLPLPLLPAAAAACCRLCLGPHGQ